MPNNFNKEEVVVFDRLLEGFNDALVISAMVSKFDMGDTTAERAQNTVWRPVPYIARSFDGMDQTANFLDQTQLSVPSTIGFQKSSPFTMNARELRDGLQEDRLAKFAMQKLASDINVSLMNTAANQGTIVIKRTAAATGYTDVAQADAAMNEIGVPMGERYLCLSSRDYNNMAGDLAARQTLNEIPTKAYRETYIGQVAGFQTAKLDYANSLAVRAGVTVTVNGANQRYVPAATSTATGGKINVDNRYQNLTVGVVSGLIKVGDAFTIAGVNSVHLVTKQDTGQLKTFRVTGIVSGGGGAGVIQISPPIIAADSAPTQPELQYKNVTATPANSAAITFLNTATASVNPFWSKDAIELLPARLVMPDAGLDTMTATTDQGMSVLMTRSGDINTLALKYRFDCFWGTVMTLPEQAGIMLFGQP